MARPKAADEVFCRSCGAAIKERAELCPECGVRNRQGGPPAGARTTADTDATAHDPTQYETTVGDNWYYAVLVPTAFTLPLLGLVSLPGSDSPLTVLAGFLLLGAVVLPVVGLYFDRQYVRANGAWNPSLLWLVALFVLYPVNLFVALFYLYRRREVLGVP
jgi:hypothetical protein